MQSIDTCDIGNLAYRQHECRLSRDNSNGFLVVHTWWKLVVHPVFGVYRWMLRG